MQELTVHLNTLYLLAQIIMLIGTVGFQFGIYWKFKKDVEIRLREHEEKIQRLDKARENQSVLLAEIQVSIKSIEKSIETLFNKIDKFLEK